MTYHFGLLKNDLLINFWMCQVSLLCRLLSAERWGYSSCGVPPSLWSWHLLLQSTVSRVLGHQQSWHTDSVVAACRLQNTGSIVGMHRLSCSAACGIFPDQVSNLCLLLWQADSLPLSLQGNSHSGLYKADLQRGIQN